MPSRYYAAETPLAYRNQHYVAVESRSIERVVAIERAVSGEPTAKPTRAVPAFTVDVEPGVVLDTLESELVSRIRELTDQLRQPPTGGRVDER